VDILNVAPSFAVHDVAYVGLRYSVEISDHALGHAPPKHADFLDIFFRKPRPRVVRAFMGGATGPALVLPVPHVVGIRP
jgi:hypothetical protein